jgi:maltose phosphorylase
MDGVECHNEWEITFEELHRNGAIAYSIYHYTRYTGDTSYVDDYGIEELIEISRFYASRLNYNPQKDKYMMLGVTGPNEYENNVNNNWYTNMLSAWVMDYTRARLEDLQIRKPARYSEVIKKLEVSGDEIQKWAEISEKMYYPYVSELGIFEQQDLYMDKEQKLVKDIPASELPLNKHWSWDRILRSCFIKQADVIQAFYFFPFKYDADCKKRNFDFYEPRTVHESSLSPSVYSIVASQIGYKQKAYELYLRTSRLDLDNYNADTEDGIHLTSMSGSWLAIVQGFAGIYVHNDRLTMKPYIPEQWSEYSFKMDFRGSKLAIRVNKKDVSVELLEGRPIDVFLYDQVYRMEKTLFVQMPEESSKAHA